MAVPHLVGFLLTGAKSLPVCRTSVAIPVKVPARSRGPESENHPGKVEQRAEEVGEGRYAEKKGTADHIFTSLLGSSDLSASCNSSQRLLKSCSKA